MLRRKPTTLLVCLVLLTSTFLLGAAWATPPAAAPEKTLDKPQVSAQGATSVAKPKAITKVKPLAMAPPCAYPFAQPEIFKVKPVYMLPYAAGVQWTDCYLPTTQVRQWDVSAGVLFARLRGKVAWPRYPSWGYSGWWGGTDETDFNDGLQLPGHMVVPTWSVTYQFKPRWAVRYSGLAFEANGGGQGSGYIRFGTWQQYYGYGQNIQSKYQHGYHRVGLLYDAVKTCKSSVRLFADWVHADDKITMTGCSGCLQNSVFSKGTDAAIAGIEVQKCVKTTSNGGTFSWDCKAGAIFLDDVQGLDVQGGAQYSIAMNSGRSGYVKGGYRLVELKKSQNDYVLNHAVEGGFMELGFIF